MVNNRTKPTSSRGSSAGSSKSGNNNVINTSNSNQVHSMLSDTQHMNEEDDDTSMYINLLPGEESTEENVSHTRNGHDLSDDDDVEMDSSLPDTHQYDASSSRQQHRSIQEYTLGSEFNPRAINIKEMSSVQPTPNEVAVAVAAAAAAGDLQHADNDNEHVRNHEEDEDEDNESNNNNNTSIQQDANSAMVTAAAAAAAEVAAAAAADSSRESESEEVDLESKTPEMKMDVNSAKDKKSKNESDLSSQEIPKNDYLEKMNESPNDSSNEPNNNKVLNISSTTDIPNSGSNETEEYSENTVRPWPIDKQLSEAEFEHIPRALRESLAQSSEYANGLTYISQIEPKSFATKADAIKYLKTFSFNQGFGIKKIDTESSSDPHLVYECNHSEKEFEESSSSLKRHHVSFSDEIAELGPCSFRVEISFNEDAGTWHIDPLEPEHNHGPTGPAASAKRRRLTYFQKTLQDSFLHSKPATLNKKPSSYSSAPSLFAGNSLYTEDSHQTHDGKKVDNLRGLVGALRFDNAYVMDRLNDKGSVTHLFWTNQECMDMLQLFPEVLFINVIRDNKAPPLVHIVGITCFNTTFEVGYGYLKTYALEGLVWVLNSLKEIATKALQTEKQYQPSAVIINHDLQLMGAVELQFGDTCQFCVSELMRDVNEMATDFFQSPEESRLFIEKFQQLVDSETADIYAFNEAGFRKDYHGTKALDYVTYHWLQQKTRFVRAWVDQHLHFNNYSMGKAEIAQATVAEYMRECDGDVLKFYYEVSGLLRRKKEAYERLLKQQQEKCPLKFFVPFFDDVRFQISTHALELIKEQHELYLEAQSVGIPLSRCTSMFTNTTGLPCKHTLARPVTMDDIHPHWWLHKQKHYRVPLSAHERKAIEISSKFERALSLAKQHFHDMVSLDLKEVMLGDVMKYFTGVGVPGIDEINSLTLGNLAKGSPTFGSRATPPLMSPLGNHHNHNSHHHHNHHLLSGSASPAHGSGRISTPTTNLHKNSVNGLVSTNLGSHGHLSSNNSGVLDESPESGSLSSSMYLHLRGSHDFSNGDVQSTGNSANTSGSVGSDGNTGGSIDNGAEGMGSPHGVIAGANDALHQNNTSGTVDGINHGTGGTGANTNNGNVSTNNNITASDTGNGSANSRYQTRSTAEFNELAAAAALAAAAENGASNATMSSSLLSSNSVAATNNSNAVVGGSGSLGTQTPGSQYPFKGTNSNNNTSANNNNNSANSTYPASMANIMNSPNPAAQQHMYYSKQGTQQLHNQQSKHNGNIKTFMVPQQYQQSSHNHYGNSGNNYNNNNGNSHNISHQIPGSTSMSSLHSQHQDSGSLNSLVPGNNNNMSSSMATPRKCGKCNQIGHNSRTCGQRISLDGL